jgi:lipoprotein-releasing system ATP-binding protein
MANILKLNNIIKIYGVNTKNPYKALHGIDLEIKDHSFNAIIGQSGSGKSTLLNIIGTLDKTTEGQVLFQGEDISNYDKNQLAEFRNRKIGFIFQFHYLLPEFTALENVLMPYQISKQTVTKEVLERADYLLDTVGLGAYKNTLSTQLSGGQQQRVAIARSLINQPALILADEPTGNLDSDTTENVYQLLRKINKELKTTFVIITHDRHVAEKADRIIELKDGEIYADITV